MTTLVPDGLPIGPLYPSTWLVATCPSFSLRTRFYSSKYENFSRAFLSAEGLGMLTGGN